MCLKAWKDWSLKFSWRVRIHNHKGCGNMQLLRMCEAAPTSWSTVGTLLLPCFHPNCHRQHPCSPPAPLTHMCAVPGAQQSFSRPCLSPSLPSLTLAHSLPFPSLIPFPALPAPLALQIPLEELLDDLEALQLAQEGAQGDEDMDEDMDDG